jgi:DNA mismatch repair protein PMS2
MTNGTIQPIDKASIHRLTSGQVITDLATAVKELVDNALDTNATTLDIRLCDYGKSLVEVSDNGAGVAPADRPLLARKYHTSKISKFDDLETLRTLGFRGEALSSLCAVSHVAVVTKVADEECGVKLEYDEHGELWRETMAARSVGTTVSVRDLFHSLPVRRKEFEKNLKRDYGRLVSLLQSYALMYIGVRFVCTNQVGSGTRTVVVQSAPPSGLSLAETAQTANSGLARLRASAKAVLGKKIAEGLLDVHKRDEELGVEVFGLVSGAGTGTARGRGDGRHFYVNARPIEFKKAGAILYDLYRNFVSPTHTQRPACVLDLRVSPEMVDVNVTPDKRTVFFHEEAAICRFIQDCLVEVWEAERSKYTVQNVVGGARDIRDIWSSRLEFSQATSQPSATRSHPKESPVGVSMASKSPATGTVEHAGVGNVDGRIDRMLLPEASRRDVAVVCELDGGPVNQLPSPLEIFKASPSVPRKRKMSLEAAVEEAEDVEEAEVAVAHGRGRPASSVLMTVRRAKPQKVASSLLNFAMGRESDAFNDDDSDDNDDNDDGIPCGRKTTDQADEGHATMEDKTSHGDDKGRAEGDGGGDKESVDMDVVFEAGRAVLGPHEDRGDQRIGPQDAAPLAAVRSDEEIVRTLTHDEMQPDEQEVIIVQETAPTPAAITPPLPGSSRDEKEKKAETESQTVLIDMKTIREKAMGRIHREKERQMAATHRPVFAAATVGSTAAGGAGASDADTGADPKTGAGTDRAEEELKRVFKKEQFNAMEVIGQFNLGFIIAKLDDDLFIIDQHASDEKHTFENLQRTTKFHKQRLIRPVPLEELTPRDREIVHDNRGVFSNSGFEFDEREGTLRLVSVPHCKGITFSSADVVEMIGMLDRGERSLWHLEAGGSESTQEYAVYPSRFRALLASKACRTSIMIGKALSKNKMKGILSNLSTLVSPWNCPHGRPTMRHLASLSFVVTAPHAQ